MTLRRLGLSALACVAIAGSVGCDDLPIGEEGAGKKWSASTHVTDCCGQVLDTTYPRRRVISFVPSVTEIIVAMGGADRRIARTRFDHDVAISKLPNVGGGLDANLEMVVGLTPDLVLVGDGPSPRQLIYRLTSFDVPAFVIGPQTLWSFRQDTHAVRRLLGMDEAADSLSDCHEGNSRGGAHAPRVPGRGDLK